MNNRKFKLGLVAAAAMNAGIASQALASGYEKSIVWGGRSAGVAGIATPYITGSQSIYFNPAGLVANEASRDFSVNGSPTFSQFKGPINNANEQATGKRNLSPAFGVTYGATLNEQWGYGLGVYASGGALAEYEGIAIGAGFPTTADVKTDLKVIEFAAGGAYKVNENLKLGAAWRVVMAQANFSLVQRSGNTAFLNAKLTNLKDTSYTGFKAGAQYKLSDKTLFGFTYRSQVDLEAEGDVGGNIVTLTPSTIPVSGSAKVKTAFPMQATLGVQHDFSDVWRFLGEYVWTNYGKVETIDIESSVAQLNGAKVQQQWKDQHNIRVAGEYMGMAWPVRAGYVWTSQVTNADWARATFTPPGSAHTFTVGTGTTFKVAERPLQFDIAGEYTTTSGDAGTPGSSDIRPGTYEAQAYAVHTGLTYMF